MGITQEDANAAEAAIPQGQIDANALEGEDVLLDSPSVEAQKNDNPGKTAIIPTPEATSGTEDYSNTPRTESNSVLGNILYGYEEQPLREEKRQVRRKDTKGQGFKWLEDNGIQLQEIIDNELGDIASLDPEVYTMHTRNALTEHKDKVVSDFVFLVVKYTDKVKQRHNNKKYGGVITASDAKGNDAEYLIIGIAGFHPTNKAQQSAFVNTIKTKHQQNRNEFFKNNKDKRFYVETESHTKVKKIGAGRLVNQLVSDKTQNPARSIFELLEEERNPKGLEFGELKWGIQQKTKFLLVNAEEGDAVYPATEGPGRVFLLVESANGKYLPAYINTRTLSELNKDSTLYKEIQLLIQQLGSRNYKDRAEAKKRLSELVYLANDNVNINIGSESNHVITLRNKEGDTHASFDVADANFDIMDLITEVEKLSPRVNITASVLLNEALARKYDEAGALTTNLAKLGTSNADFTVYPIDPTTKGPIIENTTDNSATRVSVNSDLRRASKAPTWQIGTVVYEKTNGRWHPRGNPNAIITDSLANKLEYEYTINTQGIKPIGKSKTYIIENNKDNPHVVVKQKDGTYVRLSTEEAEKAIAAYNNLIAEQERHNNAMKDLNSALEDVEEVDLGIPSDETQDITAEEVSAQLDGDFTPKFNEETTTETQESVESIEPAIAPDFDINDTGDVSIQELQSTQGESGMTLTEIFHSFSFEGFTNFIKLLESKGINITKSLNMEEALRAELDARKIPTTGIKNIKDWLKLIEECR